MDQRRLWRWYRLVTKTWPIDTDATMEHLIDNHFHQSIEAKIEHVDSLTLPLAHAATLLTDCLLQGGKVLICGEGLSAPLASTLAHCMLHGQRLERPGLPALVLSQNFHDRNITDDPFSNQISALGARQDILVAISPGQATQSLLSAIITAQQCGLDIIVLTAPGHEPIAHQLRNSDVELYVNNDNPYRVQEIHLLTLFCLCELIESNLFGGAL